MGTEVKWTVEMATSDTTKHKHTYCSERLKLLVQLHYSLTHLSLVRAHLYELVLLC